MSDITGLARSLRAQAADNGECKAYAYNDAADQVEQAWHDHAHDGEWELDCEICQVERAAGVNAALGARAGPYAGEKLPLEPLTPTEARKQALGRLAGEIPRESP